jgi:hypothetical protein
MQSRTTGIYNDIECGECKKVIDGQVFRIEIAGFFGAFSKTYCRECALIEKSFMSLEAFDNWANRGGKCRGCSRDIAISGGGPGRRYCCHKCEARRYRRNARSNAKHFCVSVKKDLKRDCLHCKSEFEPARKDAKYCSAKCRVYSGRVRKREIEKTKGANHKGDSTLPP